MEAAKLVTAVPLNSSARQIHLNKRTRRAGSRRFRVGPQPDERNDRHRNIAMRRDTTSAREGRPSE
jgi:hypothetical protein